MTLSPKRIILFIIIIAIVLIIAHYGNKFLFATPNYQGPKQAGPGSIPPEGESNFNNPFRPFNPVLDAPGTRYTISRNGLGLGKAGSQRVMKGQPAVKATDCAAKIINGQWAIPVEYAKAIVWVSPSLLQRAPAIDKSGSSPSESNFNNPFRPFNPIMDLPGTRYRIARNGVGIGKSGNQRVAQGTPVVKIQDCAAEWNNGQWLVIINYAGTGLGVTPDLLQMA